MERQGRTAVPVLVILIREETEQPESMRVRAWKLQLDDFLIWTLKETEQSESLKVRAWELQMDAFLSRILGETEPSEPVSKLLLFLL